MAGLNSKRSITWWQRLLAILGVSPEAARVRVRAPGIEVVITGQSDLVRNVLHAVKAEIERSHRIKKLENVGRGPSDPGAPAASVGQGASASPAPQSRRLPAHAKQGTASQSQIVLPSELDDMDSPYAIPEHRERDDAEEENTPVEAIDAPGLVPTSKDVKHDGARQPANASGEVGFGPEDTAPGEKTKNVIPGGSQPETPIAPVPIVARRQYDVGTTDPDLRAAARGVSLSRSEGSKGPPPRPAGTAPRAASEAPWRSEYDGSSPPPLLPRTPSSTGNGSGPSGAK